MAPNLSRPVFYIPNEKHYTHFIKMLDRMGQSKSIEIVNSLGRARMCENFYFPIPLYMGHLGNEGLLFTPEVVTVMKNKNAHLFLDSSWEPLPYEGYTSDELLKLHHALAKGPIDSSRVTLINSNYFARSGYNNWCKSKGVDPTLNVLGVNFFFQYHWELLLSPWFRSHGRSWREAFLKNHSYDDLKKFMCLNLKPRAHRTATVLTLLDADSINEGVVSYMGRDLGEIGAESLEEESEALKLIRLLKNGDQLEKNLPLLNTMTPIQLDRNIADLTKDLFQRREGAVDFLIPELKITGESLPKISTLFEIITCTWLCGDGSLYIGEKTVRPILRFQPFINVGSARSLEYLRRMGFKTFAPYINESYDSVDDPIQRLEMALGEVRRLTSMSKAQLSKMYEDLKPVLDHNFTHFVNHTSEIFKTELNENILPHLKSGSSEMKISGLRLLALKYLLPIRLTRSKVTPRFPQPEAINLD